MLDFPLVDTHLHLWDPSLLPYPWLQNVPTINKPFLLPDYNQACGNYRIARMVFVQCEVESTRYQDEAAWVSGQAVIDPRIEGIVTWAPVELGDAATQHFEHLAAHPLIKGVRRIVQSEPDPHFCLQPEFIKGVQLLNRYKLHFEICCKGDDQLASLVKLAQRCPDTKFILNHIGKPFIGQGVLDPWRSHIKAFASLPNVWCKMSGLVVEADKQHWQPGHLQPYIDHVLDSFGFNRVMFGGDWPVVLLAAPLTRWIDVLDQATAGCSRQQRQQLFHDNAVGFYRLTRADKAVAGIGSKT